MSSSPATPVSRFRELSLGSGSMPPTTRSQARRQSRNTNTDFDDSGPERESDSDSAMGDDDDDDEDDSNVVSPTKLAYSLDRLSRVHRERVRAAFDEPPQLSLEFCTRQDDSYAFHLTESVPRSIRIGTPDSQYAIPSCSCTDKPPCKHIVWFLDQIVKQTLYEQNPLSPLTMTAYGYPEEIGDPYSDISSFHLDVLADSLHCDVGNPMSRDLGNLMSRGSDSDSDSDSDSGSETGEAGLHIPNPHRVQEIREVLSSVDSSPIDEFRPDLFSSATAAAAAAVGSEREPVRRGDLEATIFRMLLVNNEFFRYVLSRLHPADPVNDPFRKLSQRVDRVLRELDAYAAGIPSSLPNEGPRDVAWAAGHIKGVVALIHTAIYKRRDHSMEHWEKTSAARALVHILVSVVERNRDSVPPAAARAAAIPRQDRNLYLCLVGDSNSDTPFVIDVLGLLPEQAAAFVHTLETVEDQLGVNGAPPSYVVKFRSLVERLRRTAPPPPSSSSSAGSKRQSQSSHDRGSKRVR